MKMSTSVGQPNVFSTAENSASTAPSSFDLLLKRLREMKEPPSLEDLHDCLNGLTVTGEDLRPHLGFKAGNYARHRVFRNEFIELLVLCWRPGQRTPIHDHNGSYGAVRVCEGVLWETMFDLDETQTLFYKSGRDWKPGDVTGADVPDIHQLGNPEVSGQNLVTLHLYAPPLNVLNTYKVGSSEVGHYRPDEFMDGAGI
jgi:cysteine dioxygenase